MMASYRAYTRGCGNLGCQSLQEDWVEKIAQTVGLVEWLNVVITTPCDRRKKMFQHFFCVFIFFCRQRTELCRKIRNTE